MNEARSFVKQKHPKSYSEHRRTGQYFVRLYPSARPFVEATTETAAWKKAAEKLGWSKEPS